MLINKFLSYFERVGPYRESRIEFELNGVDVQHLAVPDIKTALECRTVTFDFASNTWTVSLAPKQSTDIKVKG